jgi:ERCC4-related helicase
MIEDKAPFCAATSKLLAEITAPLALFLEGELPNHSSTWWNDLVLEKLSIPQRQRLTNRSTAASLGVLDLAALLRVLDQNWYLLSNTLRLTVEDRHFVKEMQTIRNRWAHTSSEGLSLEDMYRDLDTLQRFANIVRAEEKYLQEIRSAKLSLLSRQSSATIGIPVDNSGTVEETLAPATEYILGQIVALKANPASKGAIVGIVPSKPENRYQVFLGSATAQYYASQLQLENQQGNALEYLNYKQFHSHLTALQIRHPGLSTLYSLNSARVDFIPYQFRPVLKFIHSDRPRLLIADGVGVGKTIEAGLILRELQARREIKSVLILCPRPLITEKKWQNEMKRFDERFTHLDSGTLRYCINETHLEGTWPSQHQKIILPYSLLDEGILLGDKKKKKKGLLDLDPAPRFDLVIVDEAHHVHNQETWNYKAARFFCDHAEAVIFLSATPLQLGSSDLFVLLNLLRPDIVIDQKSYEHMAAPNPFINQAVSFARANEVGWTINAAQSLDQAEATAWGQSILKHRPEYLRVRAKLAPGNPSPEERVRLTSDLEALHTFAGMINRTRRRDIGEFTARKPETVVVEFTAEQRELHDELLCVQADIFSKIHGDLNVKFLMTTLRRQAASCLFGLAPLIEEILSRHLDELSWEESDIAAVDLQGDTVGKIASRINTVLAKARALNSHDPKLEALRKVVGDKQRLPNNKVMLFSCFRHTLAYLYEHLRKDGVRVGLIHGGTPDEDRIDFRNRFALSREQAECLDVLLFSEIGCEGLDYQFCDCMVNYDLPWNPMRVEQRIGRIDRKGQKSESVAIYNLITPGTVDADIYERCLLRIGVFNSALGASEEILGEITREIRDIAENFTLTEAERSARFQQLADNQVRLIQEQEELEQRQLEFFGIHLPEVQMKKDIQDASSFWLTPVALQRLVHRYLCDTSGKEQEFILGEKPLKTLRLSQEVREALLRDFQSLPRQNATAHRDWENWLKGGNPHLLLTFEAGCATQHPEAAFMTPIHPLVKQAATAFNKVSRIATALKVMTDEVPAGSHEFAIYQWQFHGIKEDLVLRPVALLPALTPILTSLLERAEEWAKDTQLVTNAATWDALDTQHYELWSAARDEHRERTQELAQYRLESLATSHRARMALLSEQLDKADNEKIQKMRQSQIAAAEADYARRIQALDIAMERADIVAGPVAYGVLMVEGGANAD